jgi:alpha-tubulin suppressor-like RCC1 family protein
MQYQQCAVPASVENTIAASAGLFHTAALSHDGKIVCWGDNSKRQCSVPIGLANVIAVCCGAYHTAAVLSDGSVVCWGHNEYGQCTGMPSSLTVMLCGPVLL